MNKLVWVTIGCLLFVSIGACKGKSGEQSAQGHKAEQKINQINPVVTSDHAYSFLKAVQNGDKNAMYSASNLSIAIANESRSKLIKIKQNKMNEVQRLEYEHALRVSGNIDFFLKKLSKMFPKSSTYLISESVEKDADVGTRHFDHKVIITYNDRSEAMRDNTGKPVKTMIVHLQQIERPLNGHQIYGFSFNSKEFDKMADKVFEVVSYF